MLQITADVFSGRPNPRWILTDENEAQIILKQLSQERKIISQAAPPEAGLGFRGFFIELLSDELARDFDLDPSIYMTAGPSAASEKANEIAERLIELISVSEAAPEFAKVESLPLDESLQTFLREQLKVKGRITVTDESMTGAEEGTIEERLAVTCYYELAHYNPGFWNNNPTICQRNNCYNYASNKRTDTFAQPGLGCGHMYTSITCAEVTRAALCDRLHKRYDCFPPSETPRYLVALVVAPGPGFTDFHWYRKMKEGFWGHKPGSTQVRNVDNRGQLITDPARCDRGPYTQFCGYFYTCRSQLIK